MHSFTLPHVPGLTVAALYVAPRGVYADLHGVDPWPESRDARAYAGPHPVVAHPPCARWGRYATGGPSNHGRFKLGDDGGCFAAALAAVRAFGGVLEHPKDSRAFDAFELVVPPVGGGWVPGRPGEWTCCVEQGHYGHTARKPTWLFAVLDGAPPELTWGPSVATRSKDYGDPLRTRRRGAIELMSKNQRASTPVAFRDLLLSIARSAR